MPISDKFPLPVKVSGKNTYNYKNYLNENLKLSWDGEAWTGCAKNNYWLHKIQNFCSEHHLKFEINNNFGKRSKTYRKEFFTHYPSILKSGKYYCAYCGKKLSKQKLTVDHLYPVHVVNKSTYYQEKLKSLGATSVNSYQNLVPACWTCNSLKSAKLGRWIIKGKIGRHQNLWPIRKFIKLIIVLSILFTIIYFSYTKIFPWFNGLF